MRVCADLFSSRRRSSRNWGMYTHTHTHTPTDSPTHTRILSITSVSVCVCVCLCGCMQQRDRQEYPWVSCSVWVCVCVCFFVDCINSMMWCFRDVCEFENVCVCVSVWVQWRIPLYQASWGRRVINTSTHAQAEMHADTDSWMLLMTSLQI